MGIKSLGSQIPWESNPLGISTSGDNTGHLVAGDWRRHWCFRSWGLETTLETWRLGSGDDTGDLAAGDWRRHWRLRSWGLETTMQS